MTLEPGGTGYCAVPGLETELEAELSAAGPWRRLTERLYWRPGPAVPMAWAADIWFDCRERSVGSIGAAAGCLREHNAWWGLVPGAAFRRSQLILAKLPRLRHNPLGFPPTARLRPLGGFTLLDRDRLVFAPQTQRPWPAGEAAFVDDREHPPSRAYKKLWEAFTLLQRWPAPGESAWDLGAAPGAWTWVLAECGARVRSIDRAPLDPRVASRPEVQHHLGSAFALDPDREAGDWLCSDVICYPDRLAALLERWLAVDRTRGYVVTVKFQGPPHPDDLRPFKDFPDSLVLHLQHNKHEVTWLRYPGLALRPWSAEQGWFSRGSVAPPPA